MTLEVQVESMSKIAGYPRMLDTKSALLEAPDSRGQWVQRSALKLPGFRLRGQWAGLVFAITANIRVIVLPTHTMEYTMLYWNSRDASTGNGTAAFEAVSLSDHT